MPRQLRVRRWPVQVVETGEGGFFRMRIEVTDPTGSGTDPAVFLFRVHPPDPKTGLVSASFVTVASPVDMEDYPADTPSPDLSNPFFRRSVVELDFRSMHQLHDTWTNIIQLIRNLLRALDQLEQFRDSEVADLSSA